MVQKTIIGITGHSGSGKGTVAQYLHGSYDAEYIKYSDVFRNVLNELHLSQSRKNIDHLSVTLREAYGQDMLGEIVSRKIEESEKNLFVVEAIRRPADIDDLVDLGTFKLLFVDVPMEVRYDRVVLRGQNPGDADKTFAEFQEDQKDDTQMRIEELKERSDFVIDNTKNQTDLQRSIEDIITKMNIA